MKLLKFHMQSNPDFTLGHAVIIAGLMSGKYSTYHEYAMACGQEGVGHTQEEYFDLFIADVIPLLD